MERVHVAAALIVRDDAALACQRADGPFAGLWELPGGKVEPGEDALAACRREVAEELGCRLASLWPLETVEYDYPDFHLSMDVFCCTLAPGEEPRAEEHQRVAWLGRDGLPGVEWLPADRGLMAEVARWWDALWEEH